jgi:hypothetical protein
MRRFVRFSLGILLLAGMTGCVPSWNHDGGRQVLSPARYYLPADPDFERKYFESGRVSFTVPDGWHWFIRGEDLIATRDGVFLQQIFVERLHIAQIDQEVDGAFPLAVLSAKQWPVHTAKSLTKRFTAGMPPADAGEVLLESRRNDPGVIELEVRKAVTRTIAGQQAFRALFDFRLKGSAAGRSPLYRSVYCGFMQGDWFYGISYTAAARYYFDRDAASFETFLESIRLADK